MSLAAAPLCPLCGGATRSVQVNARLSVARCECCRHRCARHAAEAQTKDYHDQHVYGQEEFIASLRRTRLRQAGLWLQLIRSWRPGVTRLLDFGCGHGWFLEEAAREGFGPLAGADSSQIAVDQLRQRGVEAVLVSPDRPEDLDAATLSFRPQVLTLLDVLEHFPPERAFEVVAGLAARLQPDLELVLVKVPVSSGLLYRVASSLARLGVTGPLEQLYQAGTFPPHFSYFSRASLQCLLDRAGLKALAWVGDHDFEPDGLASRVRAVNRLPRWAGHGIGSAFARAAKAMRMEDALLGVAAPSAA